MPGRGGEERERERGGAVDSRVVVGDFASFIVNFPA